MEFITAAMVITAAMAVTIMANVSMASPPYVYASRVSPYTWLLGYMPKNESMPYILNLFRTVY